MEKHLLLSSSIPIGNNDLISEIHQSIIELQWNPPENEIQKLLKDSLSFLDRNLNKETLIEIFYLITECFSHIKDKKEDIIKEICEDAKMNTNRLILFSIFCLRNDKEFKNPQTKSLIFDISKQMLKYIKSNNNGELIIFNNEISQKFKCYFIYNIISCIKTSEKTVSYFFSYLLVQSDFSKEKSDALFQKAIDANLITSLSEDLLADYRYFNRFTFENVISMLSKITDKKFTNILTLVQSTFTKKESWTTQYLMALFDKCVELEVDFSFIQNDFFFELFDAKKMNSSYWKYFFLNKVSLPDDFVRRIDEFSNPKEALLLIENYRNIPIDVLAQGLIEINDTSVYERLFDYEFQDKESNVISDEKFWVHIFLCFSSSKEKYTKPLYEPFVKMFEEFVEVSNTYEYIKAMIFASFPTTETGNQFLLDFLNNLSFKYREAFNKNIIILLTQISDMKVIPLPSFWDIFDLEFVRQYFDENVEINDPAIACAYYFINSKLHFKTIENFLIRPFTDENSIAEFIERNDMNYLSKINNDSLFVILAALIYALQDIKPEILGLTKFTILPFLAISCNFLSNEKNGNNLPLTEEMKYLLIEASKFLAFADKIIMNVSVNSILKHFEYFFNDFEEMSLDVLEIFIDQLIDGSYTADKGILLRTVFNLQNLYSKNEKVRVFFDKYGFNLIEQIFKIDDISQLEDLKFDPKIFDVKKVSSTLIKHIQSNQSYNEVINSINIILNSSFDFPDLEKNVKKMDLGKLYQKAIFRKKINDLPIIRKFIYKYNIPLISLKMYLKSKPDWDIFNTFFNSIISKLTTNENYFEAFFEKACLNLTVQPETLLEKYFDMYNKHSELFLRSLSSNFAFNSDKNIFVKLPNSSTKSESKYEFKLILFSNLLDNSNNYETFSLINKLLPTFSFIFNENDIERFFDLICKSLEDFNLYFTINNRSDKNEVNLLKVSVSAFYCLYTSLYSPRILDSFFVWLFKNGKNFSQPQSFSMAYILLSLLSTKKVKDGMLAYSSKFGFSKILKHLNQTQAPIEISSYFNEITFKLTNLYYNEILNLSIDQSLYINGLMENTPFQSIFNHFHTIYPTKFTPLQLPQVNNNEIKKFIEKFNTPSSFSIHYDHPSIEISEEQVNDFIDHFKRIDGNGNVKFNNESYHINNLDKIKICSSKFDDWVFRSFFEYNFNFMKTEAHEKILDHAKYEMNHYYFQKEDIDNFKKDFKDYNFTWYMINDHRYSQIIKEIIKTPQGITLFINTINTHRNYLESHKLFKEYFVTIINRNINNDYSYKEFINALISFSLLPEMRKDIPFLKMASNFIIKYDFYFYSPPKQFDYFICMLFGFNNDEINSIAFDLISKLDNLKSLPFLKAMINHLFEKEMAKKKPSTMEIGKLICAYPELIKKVQKRIPLIIDFFLTSYRTNIANKQSMIRIIYTLLNEISPKRTEDQVYNVNDENPILDFNESMYKSPNNEDGLSQVPQHFVDMNPTFWNLYIKHRKTLSEIVNESSEIYANFKFLIDYPELMSYQKRIDLFRKSIMKITEHDYVSLYVSRSNVLESSFEQLRGKSRRQWLSLFHVSFINEIGYDAGGLRKDWFSLISKEIFNPNFALFTLTENQTYQPNPFSGVNPHHIEYFNFIGKVIARSLIEGQYIKCHFSRSFLRQILQIPLKLKDLEDYDTNIYKSMMTILEKDVEQLYLTFSIDIDDFGETKTILLKENGDKIDVTNDNKKEYVTLYTNYKLRKSIIKQINAFCEGFYCLIPHEKIKLFSPSELDLMICGIPDIDIDDLRKNTRYDNPYYNSHPVIDMFFSAISKWNRDDLAKLLLFVTGSSQVPVGGFKEYKDKGYPITISGGGEKERLCVAHTCFNTLDLPLYESEEELNKKLLMSVQELEFGLA